MTAPLRITAVIRGSDEVAVRLRSAPDRLRERLRVAVDLTANDVRTTAVTEYLVGPRPQRLITGGPGNTGELGRQINVRRWGSATRVGASVGTALHYGAYWELGFDRKIGAGARGGPRTLSGRARDRYFEKHPPGKKHIAPRPFLQPALNDNRDTFRARVRRAAEESV